MDVFAASLGDYAVVSTLCPGGKERMRRLMNFFESRRANLRPIGTHTFALDEIERAYDLFVNQSGGVLKLAIKPR